MKIEQILQILYFLLFIYISKKIFDSLKLKKSIKSSIIGAYNPKSKLLYGVLSGALILLGIFSVIQKQYFGIVYFLTGIGFAYMTTEKVIVYAEGIYYSGRMDKWEEIKKWVYNPSSKTLELETTKPGKKSLRIIPVNIDDRDEILTIIRGKKNKKKKSKKS